MGNNDVEETLSTEAPSAPVTAQRKVRTDLEDSLPKPYVARAFITPDTDHPNGTPGRDPKGKTVLQQHASFFDQNNDGIIYPWESYQGFRALGFNVIVSIVMSALINGSFSYITSPGWIPNPLFPMYIENIHRAKHGSDSTVFDREGRFVPASFENIFSKYARTEPDKVTLKEIFHMTNSTRDSIDPFGWVIGKIEWGFLYWLAHDKDGFLPKEAVRSVFDGSLFEYYAEKNKSS